MILLGVDEPQEIGEVLQRYVKIRRRGIRVGYIIHAGNYSVECHRILIDDYIQKLQEEKEDNIIGLFTENCDLSILFIIGYFTPMMMNIVVRRETYTNSLIKLILRKITPITLDSDNEMILFLKNLHNQLEERERISEINKLTEVKGIGVIKAKHLLEKFGSFECVKETPSHELLNYGISLDVIKELKRR